MTQKTRTITAAGQQWSRKTFEKDRQTDRHTKGQINMHRVEYSWDFRIENYSY